MMNQDQLQVEQDANNTQTEKRWDNPKQKKSTVNRIVKCI